MARRPNETNGALIFQEGRCIDGEYYIIAVYDDPASCNIMFSAYELENDSTYTYPLTYSEFDNLFRFDSELMNPSNQDGRFHWVIERLDFIMNARGEKMLCLAQEPTNDEEDIFEETDVKKTDGVAPPQTGRIDAATRAKLLKELDTQDDNKLHSNLVRSEEARKRFLADLHSKRQLEQLKATQRLVKADEERESRLAKLDLIRQQQEKKAMLLKAEEEAKKSTMAQLEVLMKQKEAQAIRRLIQEKDEADRGMGKEKDAARQKRKMQERSANEIKKIEQEKANGLARKRADQVAKWEAKIAKKSKALADKARQWREEERGEQARLRDAKDRIVADLWRKKGEEWLAAEDQRSKFEEKELQRDMRNEEKDKRRARMEKARWDEDRQKERQTANATTERRKTIHMEALRQAKVDAMHRATAKREQARLNGIRDKNINAITEARMRKFRERQYLDQAKASLEPQFGEEQQGGEAGDLNDTQLEETQTKAQRKEQEEFQRTFEIQQRAERRAQRAERVKKEEAKREKLEQLGSKDPTAREITRITLWRNEEAAKKERIEKAKLDKELAVEEAQRQKLQKDVDRVQTFERLEKVRRERSRERELIRNEGARARIRDAPIGAALPMCLSY